MRGNTTLRTLDLSYCALPDKYATYVSRLIQEQAETKEQLLWANSLRKDKVQQMIQTQESQDGLAEIVLHHNMLATQFMTKLASILRNDKYTRKVDLQHNCVSEVSDEFWKSLEMSETVLSVDLRSNPGVLPEHLCRISETCLRNCELARKHQTPV